MSESQPTVKELCSKPTEEIISFLGGVYEHSAWVAQELTTKPAEFETISELAAAMKSIVDSSSREKKMELLLAHPDLCHKVEQGGTELTKESQEEQSRSGLQSLTAEELATFTKFNNMYREKFQFPFILAVRNATKHTVLAALEGRVHNPEEVEFVTAMEQVHKIAWMRLLAKIDTSDAKGFLTCHVLDTANGIPGKFQDCACRVVPPINDE